MQLRTVGVVALFTAACGSGPRSDGDAWNEPSDATSPIAPDAGGTTHDATVTEACGEASPWTELPVPAIALHGGAATGQGGAGGHALLTTTGAIMIDPAGALAPWPAIGEAPAGGTTIADGELPADLVHAGTLRLAGTTVTSGVGVRTLRVTGGDLVIAGTLQAGLDGGATQALSIDVPDGSVFLEGAIVTSAAAPNGGEHAGAITIRARRVVVRGEVLALGACHDEGNGGDGGAVSITATEGDVVLHDGRIGSSGGFSPWRGGAAGSIAITAAGSILLAGAIEAPGGDALAAGSTTSGAGGGLALTAGGDLQLVATTILRGGGAQSAALDATGGAGGAVTLDVSGTVAIAGAIDARGGGAIGVTAASAGGGGGLDIAASAVLIAHGIAADGGAGATGGAAGDVAFVVTTQSGDVSIGVAAAVTADGGDASGAGLAGSGGHLDLRTRDGAFSLAGALTARGGDAPGGTGGGGGPLHVHTDTDFDGIGGNITIEPTGVIDVSGGTGVAGGSARNNGRFGVEAFPDGVDQLAVLLNSDSAPVAVEDGRIENLGSVVARGGAAGGWGGDVIYHGKHHSGSGDPEPGQVFVDGDGSGEDGQYFMQ